MRAENLLELRLQKYKTYGLYFLISIMLIGSSYIYYYLKAKIEKNTSILPNRTSNCKKLHDELANDVYQLMKFVENKDISYAKIKEAILQNLDTIYNLTRNISIANSNIETEYI
jgi:hypothetical protein